jgi:hypothetical protein
MDPTLVNVIIGVLTTGIVQLLKKLKNFPAKFAPLVCLVVAAILVGLASVIGVDMDVNTVAQGILTAWGVAGATVLTYDQVKKLTEPK